MKGEEGRVLICRGREERVPLFAKEEGKGFLFCGGQEEREGEGGLFRGNREIGFRHFVFTLSRSLRYRNGSRVKCIA
jgi:hypothetical protein